MKYVPCLLVLCSCASILRGTSDFIWIESKEPGTTLYVDGVARGLDAVRVEVERGKDYTLRAEKEGFMTVEVLTSSAIDAVILLNFFIDLGVITIPIDLISGTAYRFHPSTYTLTPIRKIEF